MKLLYAAAAILAVGLLVFQFTTAQKDEAVAAARTTYYAQGLADGTTQQQSKLKVPAAVQVVVDGFCSGALELGWFDPSMSVDQETIDSYAAASHECTGIRFLGTLDVTSYTGDTGKDYIFVITMHGKESWWVFTFNSAGKVVDLQ